jgi:hypothetical protein
MGRKTGQKPGLGSKNYNPERRREVQRLGGMAKAALSNGGQFDRLRGRSARRRALLRKGYVPVAPIAPAAPAAPAEQPDDNFLDPVVEEEEEA